MFRLMVTTKDAAHFIAEGILETEGVNVILRISKKIPLEELESKIIMADGLLIGSPTIIRIPCFRYISCLL